jgi:hypothetical protein
VHGAASTLFAALSAADPSTPRALERFDAITAGAAPEPDFFEHSARFGPRFEPHRLTYYFDVARRGSDVARVAGERFLRLGEELGLSLSNPLVELVRDELPRRDEILQVVLGVEAPREPAALRAKYYLVFRESPPAVVQRVIEALGAPNPPPGADPAKVYILGIDVDRAGLADVKLYFRLDRALLPRAVENAGALADLLAGTRLVVLQQCLLRPERRQIYLHATNADVLTRWIDRRPGTAAIASLRERHASLRGALAGHRLEPWILSFAFANRRADLDAGNIYFHLDP